jgi:hypothetical protein
MTPLRKAHDPAPDFVPLFNFLSLFPTSLSSFVLRKRNLGVDNRDEILKIVYAGHEIYKQKYFGIFRLNGRAVLSIEVPSPPETFPHKQTDIKYMYGNSDNPIEEAEYINASHIFSEILSLSQESLSRIPAHARPNEIFVINLQNGQLQIFWSGLSKEYLEHVSCQGRPARGMVGEMFHSRKFCVFSPAALQVFIEEFGRIYRRITSV